MEIAKGSETLLLVDDDDIIIDVGKQILERLGYKVLIAQSGREAIEIYGTSADKIDLVILDMVLPDMNGDITFGELKKLDADVKVLLSSGYSIDEKAEEIMSNGGKGFVQKPFNLKQLSEKLRSILDN